MRWIGVVGIILFVLVGCNNVPVEPNGTSPDQTVESDFSTAEKAAASCDSALTGGTQVGAAMADLAGELRADPSVFAVAVNAGGNSAWVLFQSGVECIYEVIDLDDREFVDVPVTAAAAKAIESGASKEADSFAPAAALLPQLIPSFPASSKAVVANAVGVGLPETQVTQYRETTQVIKSTLERLGYVVGTNQAPVEFFERLGEQKYGVIVIETQGSHHTTDELITTLAGPGSPRATSGLVGSMKILLTGTQATAALRAKYANDLRNGRLKIRYPWYRRFGQTTKVGAYFGVTANFVRQHNAGLFANYMVLGLNAANMLETTPANEWTCEWFDLVKEKSMGGFCLGWEGVPSAPTAAVIFRNVFELMAGADYRYTRTDYEGTTVIEPEPVTPPLMGQSVMASVVWQWPSVANPVVDPQTGAQLAYLWASDPSASSPLFLAPNPTDFWLGCAGNAALAGWVQDHNELRIGGPNGYGIDIGEAGSFTLRGAAGLGPFVQGWTFKVPLGAYGSMPVYLPDGRHGPGLTLFMWTPKFKITGSSSDGLTFTVNYLLAVRAIVAPRTRVGSTDPNSVWSPAEGKFVPRLVRRGWVPGHLAGVRRS